jgi:trk system potassium uptake protein TrkA
MYAIIIGGGKVGFFLARHMLEDGHEVLVIERDSAKAAMIAEELGDIVLRGDGCEAVTLASAGMGRADLCVAVTGDDEDNLVACQVAKTKFEVPRTIARINNPKNELIFKHLGIDTTVSATSVILAQIEQELPTHPVIPLMRLRGSGLEIVEMRIPPGSRVVGQKLGDLLLPHQSLIALVIDPDGNVRVPTGETILHADEQVVAVTRPDTESQLRSALTQPA